LLCILGKRGVKGQEQAVESFNQQDGGFGKVQVGEIVLDDVAQEFGDCACQFYAGGSTTYQYKGEQRTSSFSLGFMDSLLKAGEDVVAQGFGFVYIF